RNDVSILILSFNCPRTTVSAPCFSTDHPSNSLTHLPAAPDESTVGAIEPIAKVVFIDGRFSSPVGHLVKRAVWSFNTEFSVAFPTDLCAMDSAADGHTPAMTSTNEATALRAVELILVVFGLGLVVCTTPSREG